MVSESLILDLPLENQAKTQVAWKISDSLVHYPQALAEMEARAAAIAGGITLPTE